MNPKAPGRYELAALKAKGFKTDGYEIAVFRVTLGTTIPGLSNADPVTKESVEVDVPVDDYLVLGAMPDGKKVWNTVLSWNDLEAAKAK